MTTFVGVDVNEDNGALAAVTESGVQDSVVIEYPEIKQRRHEFFAVRKRMQSAGQTAFETTVKNREKRFVHNRLHQVSRRVVEWVEQFDNPVFVFEHLKDIRDDIEHGTRMNRRLGVGLDERVQQSRECPHQCGAVVKGVGTLAVLPVGPEGWGWRVGRPRESGRICRVRFCRLVLSSR